MELSAEQVTRIASSILITDVLSFISKHRADYKEFVDKEYSNGYITKEEYDYELQTIKTLNEEVKQCIK